MRLYTKKWTHCGPKIWVFCLMGADLVGNSKYQNSGGTRNWSYFEYIFRGVILTTEKKIAI